MSPPTRFDTVEAAIEEGKRAFVIFDEHDNPTSRFENFIVAEVRQATLGDFFNFKKLVGDLRESLSERCGDDTGLDSIGRDSELEAAIVELLNQYGQERLDLSPYTIEVARRGITDIASL